METTLDTARRAALVVHRHDSAPDHPQPVWPASVDGTANSRTRFAARTGSRSEPAGADDAPEQPDAEHARERRSRAPRGRARRARAARSFAKMPIRLEPISPPVTTSAITSRLNERRRASRMNSSRPLCTKPTSICPSRTCSSMSWIWYGSSRRDLRQLPALAPRARGDPPRREALDHQLARVRLRDLEDVEVGVELDPDRAERRDRLVEQHEPRRQPQVHRVDERERLADDLDRVDLGEARAVVAVVELAQLGDELAPRAPSGSGRRGRRGGSAARRCSRSRRR